MQMIERILQENRPIVFDYDLTLYSSEESGVLHSLDEGISDYVQNLLQVSPEKANELRVEYWKKYGTTLRGLMLEKSVDPDHYFDVVQAGEQIKLPQTNSVLKNWLMELQNPKYVFTNGRKDWALMGLQNMGIADLFDGIHDISACDWVGKPEESAFESFEQRFGLLESPRPIFLEDRLDALQVAQKRGWHGVYIRGNGKLQTEFPEYDSINDFIAEYHHVQGK